MSPHLFQAVRRAALLYPERPAIIENGQNRSWAETRADIEAMAAGLLAMGVRPGDRVGILGSNSAAYIRAVFAVPRIGAIATPLNTRLTMPELAEQSEDVGLSLLLADNDHLGTAQALQARGSVARIGALEASYPPVSASLPDEPDGETTAFILFTGGSTGRAKGVMHNSRSLFANAYQSAEVMGALDDLRFLYVPPLFHVGALAYVVVLALHGGTHVPLKAFDPAAMLQIIAREKITHFAAVPTMLARIIEEPGLGACDLTSLRRVIYGASPISESLLRRAMAALPGAQFTQSYGQTETVTLTLLPPERHVIDGPLAGKLTCAGRATPGVDLQVVDDAGVPVATGALGEIVARSSAIMQGYWDRPDATADTIRNGWLHTGDIGFIDEDGFLTIVDRKKDMIISGGENIASVEVESALASHPAVAECAVIGVADPVWGESVHGVVRLREGIQATENDLIAHCRERIAAYKCPRAITISATPLPLSGAGKILKRELREALNAELASATTGA